ncbi:16172_t:CDS:2, partial [Dentiscutata heterogama]
TTHPSDLLKFNNIYGIVLRHKKRNSLLDIFKKINSENITNIRLRDITFTEKKDEILDFFISLKKLRCLSYINTNINNIKTIYEKFKNSKTLVYLKVISPDLKYHVFTENLLNEILNNENIENIIIGFDWKEENFLINKRNSSKRYRCRLNMNETFTQVSKWYFGKKHKGKIKNQIHYVEDQDGNLYLQVKLTQNQIMITDLKHYQLVKNHLWYSSKEKNTYYTKTNLNKTTKRFHRLVHSDWFMIDHINRNGLNNREKNLREVTNSQNLLNTKLYKTNTS